MTELHAASGASAQPFAARIREHAPGLAVVLAAALLMSLPLFQFKLPSGHDALEYPPRLAEFCSLVSQGHLFPTWAPDFNYGYGTPFFNFNPPLFYYIATAFHAMGANLAVSMDLACFAIMLLAGFGMYLFVNDLAGKCGACLAAVAYLTGPYLLCDLYVRMALSEFTAFAFIPFAFWGIGRAAQNRLRAGGLVIGALSTAAVLLSHNVISLIGVPALMAYVGFLAICARSWRGALRGTLVLGLGLGLAAYFCLPALLEKDWTQTGRLLQGYLNYENHFVFPHQLIYSRWGYGLSVAGPDDGMSFRVGLVQLAGLLGAAILIRRGKLAGAHRRTYWFFFWVFVAAAFMACEDSIFIWRRLPLLQYSEFPWRFLSLATFALAACFGFLGPWIENLGEKFRRLVFRGILCALLLFGFLIAHPERYLDVRDSDYAPSRIASAGIYVSTANEYEPAWVKETPAAAAAEKAEIVAGDARILPQRASGLEYAARVEARTTAKLRLNVCYYPAWKTTVDGAPTMPNFNNALGVMEIALRPGSHEVRAALSQTSSAVAGILLSLASVVLLVALAAFLAAFPRAENAGVWLAAGLLSFAVFFALTFADAREMPVPVDEGHTCVAADNAARWSRDFLASLRSGDLSRAFSDSLVSQYWTYNHEHPSFAKFLAAASHAVLKWMPEQLVAYRCGSALLYVALVAAVLLFLRRLYGWPEALFGALSVILIPPLYGHAHLATLDFPMAAVGFLAAVAFYLGIRDWRFSVLWGILLGLALDCRINALFLPVPLILWALIFHRRRCIPNLAAMLLLSPLVMAAAWPWLWHHPIERLREYFAFHAAHKFLPEFYLGQVYANPAAPWHFPFVMTLVSVPIGILAMLLLGLGRWVRRIAADDKTALLAVNFLFPLLVSALPMAPKYDGPRLFLTCFPFAACLAGAGFGALSAWLGRRLARPRASIAIAALAALGIAAGSWFSLRMIHPYEGFGYYNLLVGGRAGAHKLGFKSNFWGNAAPEVVDYINRNFEENATVCNNTGAYTALRNYRRLGALRNDISFSDHGEYLVLELNESWSRWPRWRPLLENTDPEYVLIRTFGRCGVPLLNVYKKRHS